MVYKGAVVYKYIPVHHLICHCTISEMVQWSIVQCYEMVQWCTKEQLYINIYQCTISYALRDGAAVYKGVGAVVYKYIPVHHLICLCTISHWTISTAPEWRLPRHHLQLYIPPHHLICNWTISYIRPCSAVAFSLLSLALQRSIHPL